MWGSENTYYKCKSWALLFLHTSSTSQDFYYSINCCLTRHNYKFFPTILVLIFFLGVTELQRFTIDIPQYQISPNEHKNVTTIFSSQRIKNIMLTLPILSLHIQCVRSIHPIHSLMPLKSIPSFSSPRTLLKPKPSPNISHYNNLKWFPHTYQTFTLPSYPLPSTI